MAHETPDKPDHVSAMRGGKSLMSKFELYSYSFRSPAPTTAIFFMDMWSMYSQNTPVRLVSLTVIRKLLQNDESYRTKN